MKYLSLIIFLILIVCNHEVSYSQVDNGIVCGVQGVEGPPVAPPYSIPHESPVYGEALRVLIVYVTFPDDNENSFTYNNWPKPTSTVPPEATQPLEPYIHNTEINPVVPFMSRYPAYTLSDFFCEMSFGKYDVIGDEYKVILPQNAQTYKSMGYSVGQLNNIALEKLDNENPGLDFNDYNNWTKVGNNWVYGNTTDNKVEMIIMCYRNVPGIDGSWFF
ncbi:MAG TPA: hypothetical protein VK004_04180 [Ignavibacteria bacterium]|nr:hypothetical protein [Ignavibacteria bacterium]